MIAEKLSKGATVCSTKRKDLNFRVCFSAAAGSMLSSGIASADLLFHRFKKKLYPKSGSNFSEDVHDNTGR